MTVPIRDAATVLALRNGRGEIEVFMVKRHSQLGFLGGAHVFPGGAVEQADRAASFHDMLEGFRSESACRLLGVEDAAVAQGFYVAAARELFEEAGVLLARNRSGQWLELCREPQVESRFAGYRVALATGKLDFEQMLRAERLRLGADGLCYYAHWITPKGGQRRFDTRFFLARMPAAQSAEHDRLESTGGEWLSPKTALARYGKREIELVPPTICSLDRLMIHHSAEEAIEAARSLEVVEVRPKISLDGDAVAILYPGDDDYEGGRAGPAAAGKLLNRLVLRDGLWVRP